MAITYQPWDNFFSDLETGDIILMQGLFQSSIFTERITNCNWSHSAIIINANDIGLNGIKDGPILLWESNIKDAQKKNPKHFSVTDVILNIEKDGPMLDRLKERITNNEVLKYDKGVAKRKLNFSRNQKMFDVFKEMIPKIHNYTFPEIPVEEMLNFVEGRLADIPVADDTFFCSQLVAHTYKAWGLLNNTHVDNWYAPASFAKGSWEVELEAGATLGPEIRLDLSTVPAYPGY